MTNTHALSLEDLPPCDGPKLQPFPHQGAPIKWLGRIDGYRDGFSENGSQGYVFKVRIKSQAYALKVFKFFNPEDTRDFWETIVDKPTTTQTVAYHNDPFFAECRAYGRIKAEQRRGRLKRDLVIPCHGHLYLRDKHRRVLEESGVDLEEYCLDDDPSSPRQRPIRAIVKELASSDPSINEKSLRKVLRDIRRLNKLKIYNRDIRKDNFRCGKLIDFGSAWTQPRCIMMNSEDGGFEATHARVADLVRFDDMVSEEGFRTDVRGMPNLEYCSKLRSASRRTA